MKEIHSRLDEAGLTTTLPPTSVDDFGNLYADFPIGYSKLWDQTYADDSALMITASTPEQLSFKIKSTLVDVFALYFNCGVAKSAVKIHMPPGCKWCIFSPMLTMTILPPVFV